MNLRINSIEYEITVYSDIGIRLSLSEYSRCQKRTTQWETMYYKSRWVRVKKTVITEDWGVECPPAITKHTVGVNYVEKSKIVQFSEKLFEKLKSAEDDPPKLVELFNETRKELESMIYNC